jgi:hypothetical protein
MAISHACIIYLYFAMIFCSEGGSASSNVVDMATALRQTNERIDRIEVMLGNIASVYDTDAIVPPRLGALPPPAVAPLTVAALTSLSAPALHELETYYELPHTGSMATRRRRIARKYGVCIPYLYGEYIYSSAREYGKLKSVV